MGSIHSVVPQLKASNLDCVLYYSSYFGGWWGKHFIEKSVTNTASVCQCQRTDAFELWCWRRLLRVPWTAGRSILSILKEISPEYSLEGLILRLKLQYFSHLMGGTDSLERF